MSAKEVSFDEDEQRDTLSAVLEAIGANPDEENGCGINEAIPKLVFVLAHLIASAPSAAQKDGKVFEVCVNIKQLADHFFKEDGKLLRGKSVS